MSGCHCCHDDRYCRTARHANHCCWWEVHVTAGRHYRFRRWGCCIRRKLDRMLGSTRCDLSPSRGCHRPLSGPDRPTKSTSKRHQFVEGRLVHEAEAHAPLRRLCMGDSLREDSSRFHLWSFRPSRCRTRHVPHPSLWSLVWADIEREANRGPSIRQLLDACFGLCHNTHPLHHRTACHEQRDESQTANDQPLWRYCR